LLLWKWKVKESRRFKEEGGGRNDLFILLGDKENINIFLRKQSHAVLYMLHTHSISILLKISKFPRMLRQQLRQKAGGSQAAAEGGGELNFNKFQCHKFPQ
jgi:hypothetical protein